MRQSKVEIYLHVIWKTWQREPFVTPDVERPLYRCIESEVRKLKCTVLALNGMPDHVHLVVKVAPTVSAAQLAKQVKGVSSTLARNQLRPDGVFGWQDGYGAFSVGRAELPAIIAYVKNQKRHHAEGTIQPEWEETDEVEPPPSGPGL